MQDSTRKRAHERHGEAGYVLLAVIFLCVVLLITLAIAAPKIAMSIQRDKELETVHRGEQYKRALKLYYQKFGRYPTSVDQLVETNEIRFLRKRYTDPLTGKDDWKPVYYGQAHVRPLGFFGQPLMLAGALTGTAGSMYAPVATTTTTDANGFPVASTDASATTGTGGTGIGATPPTNNGFGGNNSLGSTGGNSISSMFNQPSSSPGSTSGFGSPSGTPGTGTGTGTGTSTGTSGVFGGGPIVGFTLPVDKPSLILYKLQTRYNKWEFNYDPTEEQAQALSGLGGGSPTGANPTGLTPGNNPGQVAPGQIPTNPTATGGDNGAGSQPGAGSGSGDSGSSPQPQ
jgi:type II secretory pathway pseudopilin PulG